MKELQMLLNKWKQESDLLKQSHKEMFNPYHPLTAEHKRLRKCITEAELLLSELQPNSEIAPPLQQAAVSGQLPLSEAQITELVHIGSQYLYESVMEEGRISEIGVMEIIKKYQEYTMNQFFNVEKMAEGKADKYFPNGTSGDTHFDYLQEVRREGFQEGYLAAHNDLKEFRHKHSQAAKQSSAIVWVKASERPLFAKNDKGWISNINSDFLAALQVFENGKFAYWWIRLCRIEETGLVVIADDDTEPCGWEIEDIEYYFPISNPDESNTSAIVESEEKNYEPEARNTNEASVVSLPCTVGNSIKVPKTKTEFIEWINKDFESTIKNYALIEKKDLGWCINGIHVLKTMCEKAGLNAGVASSEQLIETLESLLNNSNHQ